MKMETMLCNQDGRHVFGVVRVDERGQITLPAEARGIFGLHAGEDLLVLGDETKGIALVRADSLRVRMAKILHMMGGEPSEIPQEKDRS